MNRIWIAAALTALSINAGQARSILIDKKYQTAETRRIEINIMKCKAQIEALEDQRATINDEIDTTAERGL